MRLTMFTLSSRTRQLLEHVEHCAKDCLLPLEPLRLQRLRQVSQSVVLQLRMLTLTLSRLEHGLLEHLSRLPESRLLLRLIRLSGLRQTRTRLLKLLEPDLLSTLQLQELVAVSQWNTRLSLRLELRLVLWQQLIPDGIFSVMFSSQP